MTNINLDYIKTAAKRIKPHIRRTPMIAVNSTINPISDDYNLSLKLENMQITGSFKARGALNAALSLSKTDLQKGLICASGGNHGLGVAYCGWKLGVATKIYLPKTTSKDKIEKFRKFNANINMESDIWDDANAAAIIESKKTEKNYLHPFAQAEIISGQGTLALEILNHMAKIDVILVSIGGGGLISGIAIAAKAINPAIKIIGIEPIGAATLHDSVKFGKVITLNKTNTKAITLAPRRSDTLNLAIINQYVDDIILISDDDMQKAAIWLWQEFAQMVELSAAAGIAALQSGKYKPAMGSNICSILCGVGTDGLVDNNS